MPTTSADFFQHGTQPLGGKAQPLMPITPVDQCHACHGGYNVEVEPSHAWKASMMGQSARDPLFYAGLAIANQDADGAGQYCIRCHVPSAFLEGRATPPDGSAFIPSDLDGINCTFCHRVVDPNYKPSISPVEDQSILAALDGAGYLPFEPGNAQYVIDPVDNRRGPRDDIEVNLHPGNPIPEIIVSPFHSTSEFCWTCHDVSNPLLVRQQHGQPGEDSYILSELGFSHPTGDQKDMFPLHRTYSEWLNSYYSTVGVQHNGRFGGNHPTGVMKTCQDCHMPMTVGFGCSFPSIFREDLRHHTFVGSNTWVLRAVRDVYPDSETGLTEESVNESIQRNIDFLERASDLQVNRIENNLVQVRIINRTGHKLPTGFPDGRRMWINARFYGEGDELVHEHGAYDFETAALEAKTTKVYEVVLGIDADQAALVGHPEGKTLHFMLANEILKDNRIPPVGWFRSTAAQLQTLPVGTFYASGQHWDDTYFAVPPQACRVVVTVYYQTTSREFIEFLRDASPPGDDHGLIAYDLWELHGKSQPVVMDMVELTFFSAADFNQDGVVDVSDLLALLAAWGSCPATPAECPADLNGDGVVDVSDLLQLLASWGATCE